MRAVRVQDIVLDESHRRWNSEDSLGTILYTELNDDTPERYNFSNLEDAKPLFYNMDYPIPNELVFIITAPSLYHNDYGQEIEYYFPAIALHKSPTSNALPQPSATFNQGDYYTGVYYKENVNIRPLRVYEGDVLIEGRFGNSIRFGSTVDNNLTLFKNYWSNKGKKGNPITIIRNGQNPGSQDHDNRNANLPYVHILEDIQNDNATIALCAMQEISNFTPASLHMDSYGYNKTESTKKRKEIVRDKEDMYLKEDEGEDIQQTTTPNLPAAPIRHIQDSNLGSTNEDTTDFDIAPTTSNVIFPEDDTPLESETDESDNDINTILGTPDLSPLPAVQDQTFFDNLDGLGGGGYGGQ